MVQNHLRILTRKGVTVHEGDECVHVKDVILEKGVHDSPHNEHARKEDGYGTPYVAVWKTTTRIPPKRITWFLIPLNR